MHAIGTRVGYWFPGQYNLQIRLTERDLLLGFVCFLNQPVNLAQVCCTFFDFFTSQFTSVSYTHLTLPTSASV